MIFRLKKKSHIELIAVYIHPKNSNHLRSHLRAIIALDHSRLGLENNRILGKQIRPNFGSIFCQLVMYFTVFFHWMLKMKYICYQQSSLIHGWFVYWIFVREMRRLPKLEIRFRMHRFRFYLAGCGLKSPSSDSGLTW